MAVVEGVGGEETGGGGANEFQIKEEQQHEEKSGCESETRKSPEGNKENLTAKLKK